MKSLWLPFRHWLTLLITFVLAVLVALGTTAWTSTAAAATPRATISLTFDDGRATQYQTGTILASHGMHGTFYVNSGMVGSGGWYMNWSQVWDLARAGNEIGGHTLHHPDLTKVSLATAKNEINGGRELLISHGLVPSSFAYPYSAFNATTERLVKDAGYASGRIVGGGANSIPPWDAYQLWTAPDLGNKMTLSYMKNVVLQAESQGRWAILCFHGFNDGTSESITTATFSRFLDWLKGQPVSVRTVGQVMAGQAPRTVPAPVKKIPSPPALPPGSQQYTIQPGDLLSTIAARFGISLKALEAANPQITDPNRIEVGQRINVPSAPKATPKPSVKPKPQPAPKPSKATSKPKPKVHHPTAAEVAQQRLTAFMHKLQAALVFKLLHLGSDGI